MKCNSRFANFVAALLFCAAAPLVVADNDWPTFRGSDRTGVAPDTGLLQQWPAAGPDLIWEVEGAGRGYASVAISAGRLYTLGDGLSTAGDTDEYLSCFDQATGKQIWTAKTGPAWNEGESSWQSSRGTPTVDGDRVYVITPQGKLVCVSTDGAELWRVDLKEDFGGKKDEPWGYSESVLIDGDKLICTPGGTKNTMVALDKATGKKIWSASRADDRGAGHASVVISQVGSTRVYVQTTASGALGVRASDGKLLWSYEIERTTAVIPTPIVRDDLVFFSVGYNRGGALLRQIPSDSGVSVKEIYPLNPKLNNRHGGVVLVGDYLYADSDSNGIPFCAELMTGEVQWKSRGSGKKSASIVAADGHLYIRYANGTMTLVKADPESFQEVGSFKVPGSGDRPSWAHPVVLGGRLYLREGDRILCYDLKSSAHPTVHASQSMQRLDHAERAKHDLELDLSDAELWTIDTVHLGTQQIRITHDAGDNAAVMTPTWSASDRESDDVGVRNIENGRLQLYQLVPAKDCTQAESEFEISIPQTYIDEGKLEPWIFIQAGEAGYYRWSGTVQPLESFADNAGQDVVLKVTERDFLEGKKRNQIEMMGLQLHRNGSTVTEPIVLKRITVKLPEPELIATEMLTNGNFSDGTENWQVEQSNGATTKVEVLKEGPKDASAIRMEVLTGPEEPWQLQMYQAALKIEQDEPYVMTFWAKSNRTGVVKAICMQNHEPWEHSKEEEVYLSTEWEQVEFTFDGPSDDEDARITFTDLGTDEGRVYWFADCSLKRDIADE